MLALAPSHEIYYPFPLAPTSIDLKGFISLSWAHYFFDRTLDYAQRKSDRCRVFPHAANRHFFLFFVVVVLHRRRQHRRHVRTAATAGLPAAAAAAAFATRKATSRGRRCRVHGAHCVGVLVAQLLQGQARGRGLHGRRVHGAVGVHHRRVGPLPRRAVAPLGGLLRGPVPPPTAGRHQGQQAKDPPHDGARAAGGGARVLVVAVVEVVLVVQILELVVVVGVHGRLGRRWGGGARSAGWLGHRFEGGRGRGGVGDHRHGALVVSHFHEVLLNG